MPVYDYECAKCKRCKIDVYQVSTTASAPTCRCKGPAVPMERLVTVGARPDLDPVMRFFSRRCVIPLNDFQCSKCGAFEIDVYQPLRDAAPPPCPEGCQPDTVTCFNPITTMERLWSAGSASSPFKEISVEIQGKTVVAKSMADIREIERKTCDAWQRGVPGVAPLIFRNFSQDRSNRDVSPIDQHFSHLLKHQRGGAPTSGNPNDRRELFTKSGKRKIDIRALSPREREHVMREEGFGED